MRAKFPRQFLSTLLVCLIGMGMQGCEQPNPASPSNDVTSHDPAPRSVHTTNNTTCTCDFSGSDMSGADLSWSNGSGCNFSNGTYTKVLFTNGLFSNSLFTNGLFSNSLFTNGLFSNSSFQGSDLREANFRDAVLTGVDFTGANLQEAVLEGATGLTADQLCQAISLKEAHMDGQLLKLVCELCPALVGDACRE